MQLQSSSENWICVKYFSSRITRIKRRNGLYEMGREEFRTNGKISSGAKLERRDIYSDSFTRICSAFYIYSFTFIMKILSDIFKRFFFKDKISRNTANEFVWRTSSRRIFGSWASNLLRGGLNIDWGKRGWVTLHLRSWRYQRCRKTK